MPATRISKNSSRLLLKMVMNFTRSINGCVGSCASSRTRRLNSSQLNSRLMKLAGSEKSRSAWIASGRRANSSVVTSAAEVCIWSLIQLRAPEIYATLSHPSTSLGMTVFKLHRHALCSSGDLLMTNVFGGGGVNGVLGDVGGVVPDAFEVPGDKHQVDVTAQLFRIARHTVDQLTAHLRVHFIKGVVLRNNGACSLRVFPDIGIDAVSEHGHGVVDHRIKQKNLRQRGVLVQFARFTGDVGGLIGHALEVRA